ncbi:MAG: DMT family transporter [Alphaproteobacteria bacterium]|nr:DMT family transporter [Alphaproteobacteria bacterium]
MTAAPRGRGPALITLAALALAWGTNWPFMKLAFAELPVWGLRAWSCLIAGCIIMAIARLRGARLWTRDPAEWRFLCIAAFFNVTIWQVTTGYGVRFLGSGHAAILAFTMPLWSGLIAFTFLGERPTLRFAVALAMGMGGVALLSMRGGGFAWSELPGIAFMFAAAIGWAIGTLYSKRHAPTLSRLAMTAWQMLLGALPILAIWPLMEPVAWPHASWSAWMGASFTTFIALVVGYIAWFRLVELLPAHIASLASLAAPVVAMLTGAAMLREALGLRELVALGLMVGALALVLIVPARPAPARATG